MIYLQKINGKAEPEKKAIINQKRIITLLHIEKKNRCIVEKTISRDSLVIFRAIRVTELNFL